MALKRVFIAVNLPRELKKKIIRELLSHLPKNSITINPAEKMHLTLKFFGEIPGSQLTEILEKMQTIAKQTKKFEIQLNEIGHFNGKVIWLGAKDSESQLKKIHDCFESENHQPFHAHLTLARNKKILLKQFLELAEKLKKKNFHAHFLFEHFELVESRFNGKEHQYSVIQSFKLDQP